MTDTKLCGAVNTLEGRDATQRDLDRLERWANANLIKFNQAKCKVLHWHRGNSRYLYRLGRKVVENSPVDKDLGVTVDEKLSVSQQCMVSPESKENRVLGCIQRSMASRLKDGILPLYSALVTPHLEY
ncbi:rna-directed dna polymerase from mobile element jockey-like [Willisornis vidua]|uniref:Rna-directed dna polymerase from mobile element jockey-like n=1 Tax=Willisornis vidua TaxID=1566151 RepID=A0ABQ9CW16_9PASS|nr:rna-directed dna polymerase from mobile element jockey-like [Willisornis vidua]